MIKQNETHHNSSSSMFIPTGKVVLSAMRLMVLILSGANVFGLFCWHHYTHHWGTIGSLLIFTWMGSIQNDTCVFWINTVKDFFPLNTTMIGINKCILILLKAIHHICLKSSTKKFEVFTGKKSPLSPLKMAEGPYYYLCNTLLHGSFAIENKNFLYFLAVEGRVTG